MRQFPTHEEFHDKKTDRSDPSRLTKASQLWQDRLAPPLARSRQVATERLAAVRAVVAPFVAARLPGHSRKVAVAAGVLSCLGMVGLVQGSPAQQDVSGRAAVSVANQWLSDGANPVGTGGGFAAVKSKAQLEAEAKAAAQKAAAKRAAAAKAKNQVVWRNIKPVAGLSQAQMNNAQRIVNQGRVMRMPKRALVAAVACAMQESRLLNLASTALPQSYKYRHEGQGSDHDSVGLFQQRPSSGWGSVKSLMWPAYSSKQFYSALKQVPGWRSMRLTYAIQAVQVSAYPDAYAKHEAKAQAVVNALLK
jgi:hypothetical protein